jgi:hypothetical protein
MFCPRPSADASAAFSGERAHPAQIRWNASGSPVGVTYRRRTIGIGGDQRK